MESIVDANYKMLCNNEKPQNISTEKCMDFWNVLWKKVANKMQNTTMQSKYSYINHHYTLYNEILTCKDIFQAQYSGYPSEW